MLNVLKPWFVFKSELDFNIFAWKKTDDKRKKYLQKPVHLRADPKGGAARIFNALPSLICLFLKSKCPC